MPLVPWNWNRPMILSRGRDNDYMPVVPTITTTAETALSWNVGSDTFRKSISAGMWTFPELELQEGQNSVSITGEGTTAFRYREGRL